MNPQPDYLTLAADLARVQAEILKPMTTEQLTTKEYPCPFCQTSCEVREQTHTLQCPCCNARLGVDRDAEFTDGMWRDLTRLYVQPA